MTQNKMIQPRTGRHEERKNWQEIEYKILWEEKGDWRIFM